jgi:hypothetical protein
MFRGFSIAPADSDPYNISFCVTQPGRAMAQAVSRRPLTAAAWVRAHVSPVGFVVDKVALRQVFLRVLRFSPVNISTVSSTFPKIKKK